MKRFSKITLNIYNVKKWAAFLILGIFPILTFMICGMFFGMLEQIGISILGALLFAILCNMMITNPFSQMLEGKGLLTLNIDSTGIITPFILGFQRPFLKGKFQNNLVSEMFNRKAVFNLDKPNKIKDGGVQVGEEYVEIKMNKKEFVQNKFIMMNYPVLIYNAQLNTCLTKDFFSELEKSTYTENFLLYAKNKLEQLDSALRDFNRYVVDNLNEPRNTIMEFLRNNKVVVIVVVIVIILIMGFIFLPRIMGGDSSGLENAISTVSSAVSNQPVIPR